MSNHSPHPAKTGANHAIFLFRCPDRVGIVAAVSQFIARRGGNIVDSSQHSEEGEFFMRVEWSFDSESVSREMLREQCGELAERFNMEWRLRFSDQWARLAIFVSRQTHCLYDLLLRHREGDLSAEVALVISNHRDAEPIADWFGVPFHYFAIDKERRDEVEREEIALLTRERIDVIALARYMQILTSQFVDAFPNRIINIHHSFLPAFVGARPYHQAFNRGVKIIGATSHYVTADLDQGPIIEQGVTRVSHRDSVDELLRKGRNIERVVLNRAVRLHLEHRVLTSGNKTVVFQ